MRRLHRILALALAPALLACGDDIAGPKAPSATSTIISVVTTLSKLVVQRGDTMRFSYVITNLTGAPLTLNTVTGCQIKPELDQAGGRLMNPRALTDALYCPPDPTIQTMAVGGSISSSILLRGYDPSKLLSDQRPGYLLTTGTFDASVLVTATELVLPVRSDWVRFTVK